MSKVSSALLHLQYLRSSLTRLQHNFAVAQSEREVKEHLAHLVQLFSVPDTNAEDARHPVGLVIKGQVRNSSRSEQMD